VNIAVNPPNPNGYNPQQTRAAFNQAMAKAHSDADMRYNMKPLDKAGMSRGGAQQYMAGIASAKNLADGVSQAYAAPVNDAVSNANLGLADKAAAEGLGLGISQIAQQNQYANALAALQRQQAAYGFQNNILGGLLGNFGGVGKNASPGSGWLDNFLGY
jgi:chorismate synthase